MVQDVASACDGQETCTFSVPNDSRAGKLCNGGKCNGDKLLIGSYDCV